MLVQHNDASQSTTVLLLTSKYFSLNVLRIIRAHRPQGQHHLSTMNHKGSSPWKTVYTVQVDDVL